MDKKLEEMSLKELWQLFPIFLVRHHEGWNDWYVEEESNLTALLPRETVKRISHVGSTAVPDIWAKNIVDILLEVGSEDDLDNVEKRLLQKDWRCMSRSAHRVSMNKGYTPSGFAQKVFHLHVRLWGDNNELYFRDYLREFPAVAKAYEALKLSLWRRFEHDRDGYTEAKGDFIKKYTSLARQRYGARY